MDTSTKTSRQEVVNQICGTVNRLLMDKTSWDEGEAQWELFRALYHLRRAAELLKEE